MLALIHSLVVLFASQIASFSSTSSVPNTIGNDPPIIHDNSSLHITALVGQNNHTVFQCWKIHPDYFISTTPGVVGARIQNIGDIAGASLVFLDPTSTTFAGLHSVPIPQFVVFLSGGGYVRLPASGEYLPIVRGTILIATDTTDVSPIGHDSVWFPGTVALQLPFANGEVNHTVLNIGPCDST